MGRDKALLPFRGGALAQSVAQAVSEAAGAALETVRTVRLPMAEASLFQNVNTPEEWAGHAAG
jgi:molybdopterin-guanine dinucleotide biosynthesis protein A